MERTRGFSTLTKRFDDVFPRFARRGVAAPTALLRAKGGILFPKRIPPLKPPEKGEGSPPSTPALAVGRLKDCSACGVIVPAIFYLNDLSCSYLRCRFACDSAAFSNSRLLWILSDLQVPTKAALLRSPRLLALSAEGDYTAPTLRFESGSGCKKQRQIV